MKLKRDIFSDLNSDKKLLDEELSLLFLVPLIQTAWVCNAVSPREKYIIFLAAREENIDERHSFNDVIDEWLKNQPGRKFFDDCLNHIRHLLKSMTVVERHKIKTKILERCRRVAAVAGAKDLMDVNHHVSIKEENLLSELQELLT